MAGLPAGISPDMVPGHKRDHIFQIQVIILGIRPLIHRTFKVRATTTLNRLHRYVQIIMGWEDRHLHRFEIDGKQYLDPASIRFEQGTPKDESLFTLRQLARKELFNFHYLYDFNDGWEHELLVEKILTPRTGDKFPVCIDGARACPPEESGGHWGYSGLVEILQDPNHPDHDAERANLPDDFDPERFDLEWVNMKLNALT